MNYFLSVCLSTKLKTLSVQQCTRVYKCATVFQNVPECSRMHAECSRGHAECSRIYAEFSRMFQNACRKLQNVLECMQNVQECFRMFKNVQECFRMKFHELACSFISLYAVPFLSEQLIRISQCLFGFHLINTYSRIGGHL